MGDRGRAYYGTLLRKFQAKQQTTMGSTFCYPFFYVDRLLLNAEEAHHACVFMLKDMHGFLIKNLLAEERFPCYQASH